MYDFNNQNKPTKQQSFSFRQLGFILPLLACMLCSDLAQAQLPVWNLSQKFGLDHPLNSNVFFPVYLEHQFSGMEFADVDGDGDYDCVTGRIWGGTSADSSDLVYFENIGTSTFPIFTQRYGSTNPFDTIDNVNMPRLVDLDADGDLDLIVNSQVAYTSLPRYVWYYENTGSATNPIFVARSGAQNPFDTVGFVMNAHPQNINPLFYPIYNLVDIDADGDLDNIVFYVDEFSDLYLNVGSAVSPDFVLQSSSSNPFNNLTNPLADVKPNSSVVLIDFDSDNDLDIAIDPGGNSSSLQYYENIGDSSSAVFTSSNVLVLDSTYNGVNGTILGGNDPQYGHYSFVDIDGDSDLDVFELDWKGEVLNYYENMEIMLNVEEISPSTLSLSVAPNPSSGYINFETSYNGQLFVYGIAGRLLKRIDLMNDNSVDLSDMDNGTYYLVLDADKKRYQTTLVLQK